MRAKFNPFDPFGLVALGLQQQKLMISAAETVARRMQIAGTGKMSPVEMAGMMMEKPTAFAQGYEKAARAAAQGRAPVAILTEFYDPMTRKASSNAKRLRR